MKQITEPLQITEFRANLNEYFDSSALSPLLITSARKKWSRVLIDLGFYNQLVEMSEDYMDSKELVSRVKNDSWKYFSINEV